MNTTDNIKSLFNSANPMATENSYEPSGVCIGDTLLDNTPSGFALFQAIGGHYTSPAQAIEELVDNAISSIRANGGSGKVILCLTDGGDYVDISVCDSGTGISDLGAALTISGRGGAQTPLNEHGCGLKNALSYLSEEAELWLLESRTKEDAAADRYRCVSAPYAAIRAAAPFCLRPAPLSASAAARRSLSASSPQRSAPRRTSVSCAATSRRSSPTPTQPSLRRGVSPSASSAASRTRMRAAIGSKRLSPSGRQTR